MFTSLMFSFIKHFCAAVVQCYKHTWTSSGCGYKRVKRQCERQSTLQRDLTPSGGQVVLSAWTG